MLDQSCVRTWPVCVLLYWRNQVPVANLIAWFYVLISLYGCTTIYSIETTEESDE